MIQNEWNPKGAPKAVYDGIRKGVITDRSQYYQDPSHPFYGANCDGSQSRTRSRRFCARAWGSTSPAPATYPP